MDSASMSFQVISLLVSSAIYLGYNDTPECVLSGSPVQAGGGMSCLRGDGGVQSKQAESRVTKDRWAGGWSVPVQRQDRKTGAGDKKPPERKQPAKSEMLWSVFDELLKAMDDVINGFQVELDKDEELKLIFSFDLDGTLFQLLPEFDGLEDFALQKGLEDLEWNNELLIRLQQKWYAKFTGFHHKNKGRVLLIENTARALTRYDEMGRPELDDSGVQAISLDMTGTHFFPESTRNERLKAINFKINERGMGKISIPAPDVLILGSGQVVQLSDELDGSFRRARIGLNDKLTAWLEEDWRSVSPLLRDVSQSYSLTSAFSSFGLTTRAFFPTVEGVTYLPDSFQWSDSQIVVTPLLVEKNTLKKIYFSDVTANKGSTLLMVLNMLSGELVKEGKKPSLLFAFGDSLMDMTMLRPDLLIFAIADASEIAEQLRSARFSELGYQPQLSALGVFWVCSVVAHNELILEGQNPRVEGSLDHPRVLYGEGLGLLSLLQKTLDKLKDQISPENIAELQRDERTGQGVENQ
ncbi:hypothetical protein [Endozoicomonas arenosclerae]|uniref:hypothetical protein n=1 Tax=Endozoicomonas arenosclerae TaxID=1633495 RepID=UPI000786419B|nr:hypothetical protein [Endozoicomonas arenosclerae]